MTTLHALNECLINCIKKTINFLSFCNVFTLHTLHSIPMKTKKEAFFIPSHVICFVVYGV